MPIGASVRKLPHTAEGTVPDNMTMPTGPLPPIKHEPPYSMAFVSHLHAGCYAASPTAAHMQAVRRDARGAQIVSALIATQLTVRALEDFLRNHSSAIEQARADNAIRSSPKRGGRSGQSLVMVSASTRLPAQ